MSFENFFSEIEPDTTPSAELSGPGWWKRLLGELLQTVLIAALLYLGINAITVRIYVQSISMQPTLYEKDSVLVNKLAYRLDEPQRGDVIVFRPPPAPDGEPYIKRLIGLPGDEVQVANGKVYINGTALREPYISAPPTYQGTWIVPEGYLFVLGDNRNSSSDSHQWGVLPIENIIGRAEFVYFPVAHWQVLHSNTAAAAGP